MEETIQTVLQDMLDKLGVSYQKLTINLNDTSEYVINIDSDESSILIGHHGETIYACQHVLKSLLRQKIADKNVNVKLDVDNYRQRQEENIKQIAERKVTLARNTRQKQSLLPMSPYFRRIIHLHLTKPEFDDITTESVGSGDHRKVVIIPNNETF